MITYKQACEQVGYDRSTPCPIKPIIVYFAYKDGVAKKFETKHEAQVCSKNVEAVTVNMAECDAWWEAKKQLEGKVIGVWYEALEAKYITPAFTKELFELCYSEAYERGHHAGYDEVASYIDDYVEFALKARSVK